MLNQALINPASIVVVGASQNRAKPGGHLLHNLLQHPYQGQLLVLHPTETEIQGVKAYPHVADLPDVDLAILAISAEACVPVVRELAAQKGTRAFVVVSAGFGESGAKGKALEQDLLAVVNSYGASLIGPNCIGLITPNYAGVFTEPVPVLDSRGIDFISGSGATAVFILEAGRAKGLRFASVFSVGNSAQIGVEELLADLDETYQPGVSAPVKLLYLESISAPEKLLRHARSLVRKGCRIAAIKAGVSTAGARAAQSHTGAMLSPDRAVDALFRKAGIVRCSGREELINQAALFLLPELPGKRLAIITHAGGPAVMLTDRLEKGGFELPQLPDGPARRELKAKLYPGASEDNPIDFLATGTAEQLGLILDACESQFPEVDGMIVIFGSPGLVPVDEVYQLLARKMKSCSKPIYPVLPSVVNAREAMQDFIRQGHVCFTDEVQLAQALIKWKDAQLPLNLKPEVAAELSELELLCQEMPAGFVEVEQLSQILEAAQLAYLEEQLVYACDQAMAVALKLGFPVVLKVVGPLHKSDVGGVRLNLRSLDEVAAAYQELIAIAGAKAISVSPMLSGAELFIGAKREPGFPPLIAFGLGGIWLEMLNDIQTLMAPLGEQEVRKALRQLKCYPLFEGMRGQAPISEQHFAELVCRVGALMLAVPRIHEIDLNPILASSNQLIAVDARIRLV